MSLKSVRKRPGIVVFAALCLSMSAAGRVAAQGGEPRSFAIRGAKVVAVSGAPLENATVLVSRGVITAVGTSVTIPADAWVIEGKGLTVYPGLVDAFTDVGMAATPGNGMGAAPAKAPDKATKKRLLDPAKHGRARTPSRPIPGWVAASNWRTPESEKNGERRSNHAAHNDARERLLRLNANTRRDGCWQRPQASRSAGERVAITCRRAQGWRLVARPSGAHFHLRPVISNPVGAPARISKTR